MSLEQLRPIVDDDQTIAESLKDANLPALMCAMVHMTGDPTIIRGSVRPDFAVMADPQGGIPAEDQELVRGQALAAIAAYRDGDGTLPDVPAEPVIREMLDFITGQEVPSEYVEFLESELALRDEEPYGQPAIETVSAEARAGFRVIVIGAGMSGILAGIRLQAAGIPFTIIEKNSDVGGTWFENTYPGCRVDSANHTYSYSFAPNDWPQHFSSQGVLLDYFRRVASEFNIRDKIRFDTEVVRALFDEVSGSWQVSLRASGGVTEELEANAIIAAVGQLNRPRFPDIAGVGSFAGPEFHSAQWEHEHDLTDKKVIVIGTGASAFQFVPEIAPKAGEITIFQRTPPWILPNPQYHDDIPEGKHWLLNHVPYYAKWFRFLTFWRSSEGLLSRVKKDPAWNESHSVSAQNDELRQLLTAFIQSVVGDDQALFEKALPDYPPAGKRMLIDNGNWLMTLRRDNVDVVTDPVIEINENGVRTENGTQYDADVLVYGTGFHANRFLWPMEIRGRGSVELHEHWAGDPRAYLGITVPQFPNLFCMYGPNTNIVVNGSIIFFSECEIRYILGCIALLLGDQKSALEPRQDVHDAFNVEIDEANANMAWGAENVSSWYKNDKGRVTQNWPFTLREFWQRTRAPDPADFILY